MTRVASDATALIRITTLDEYDHPTGTSSAYLGYVSPDGTVIVAATPAEQCDRCGRVVPTEELEPDDETPDDRPPRLLCQSCR